MTEDYKQISLMIGNSVSDGGNTKYLMKEVPLGDHELQDITQDVPSIPGARTNMAKYEIEKKLPEIGVEDLSVDVLGSQNIGFFLYVSGKLKHTKSNLTNLEKTL